MHNYIELTACPFCGRNAVNVTGDMKELKDVIDNRNGLAGCILCSISLPVALWNQRPFELDRDTVYIAVPDTFSGDKELSLMDSMHRHLLTVSEGARDRILAYLKERYAAEKFEAMGEGG